MQNNLSDLNNHLFSPPEFLESGELSEKDLDLEKKAITQISSQNSKIKIKSLEELAGKLKETSAAIESFCRESLQMSAQSLSEKYVKEQGLEYIEDEIKAAFKAGFMTYGRQEKAGMFKREEKNEQS